jgi:hypothetical protein
MFLIGDRRTLYWSAVPGVRSSVAAFQRSVSPVGVTPDIAINPLPPGTGAVVSEEDIADVGRVEELSGLSDGMSPLDVVCVLFFPAPVEAGCDGSGIEAMMTAAVE